MPLNLLALCRSDGTGLDCEPMKMACDEAMTLSRAKGGEGSNGTNLVHRSWTTSASLFSSRELVYSNPVRVFS